MLKRNPDLPEHTEERSPVLQYLQLLFFPSLWSGFLGQQQHPVSRVCVSTSPRLVQSPSTCPFPSCSQFFPQPRIFPALGWGRHHQITGNAANQHLKGAHEMQMRILWGQQGTYYSIQEHGHMLSFVQFIFPQQGARSPSIRDAHPLGNNAAGITVSSLQSVGLSGSRGSDCTGALCWAVGCSHSPGSIHGSKRSVRFSATQRLSSSCMWISKESGKGWRVKQFELTDPSIILQPKHRPKRLGRCEYTHCMDNYQYVGINLLMLIKNYEAYHSFFRLESLDLFMYCSSLLPTSS